jgi:hypothetical protein
MPKDRFEAELGDRPDLRADPKVYLSAADALEQFRRNQFPYVNANFRMFLLKGKQYVWKPSCCHGWHARNRQYPVMHIDAFVDM